MQNNAYRSILIRKTNLNVIEYMQDNKYPLYIKSTEQVFLQLNLRNYVCLDDIINENSKFNISDEGVVFIFVLLYHIIRELEEKKLQYFRIQKQHIWININGNWIDGIILTYPQLQFESNFYDGKFKKKIFIEICSILEFRNSSNKSKKLLDDCLKIDMNKVRNLEPQIEKSHISFSKEIINQLENSISKFMEQLKEIKCNIKEFQTILQNVSYYFYKTIIQEKSVAELNEKLIIKFIELKALCQRYDPSYEELSNFTIQEHIIDKLECQNYFIDGRFQQDYQKFLLIVKLLREIKQIINIDEKKIFKQFYEFNEGINICTSELLERIEKEIIQQLRNEILELN